MRLNRVRTCFAMAGRQLLRSRITMILLLVVPSLFLMLIVLTTTTRPVPFKLASIAGQPVVTVAEQSEALVFMGVAAVAVLASFLGLSLVQKQPDAIRRLVLCGYQPAELITAKVLLLMAVAVAIGTYVALLTLLVFTPERTVLLATGFGLAGWVYGCYGMLVGVTLQRELEGVLCIVLLVNIDAGWLQNPIFYAEAQNQAIIRALPGYLPAQVSMVAAFSDFDVTRPVIGSFLYGYLLLAAALAIFWWRVRINR